MIMVNGQEVILIVSISRYGFMKLQTKWKYIMALATLQLLLKVHMLV